MPGALKPSPGVPSRPAPSPSAAPAHHRHPSGSGLVGRRAADADEQGFPATPFAPGRNARWLVEWREPLDPSGRRTATVAREIRGGHAVRSFALGPGVPALAGEFRLTAPGLRPTVVDRRRLREWDPAAGPPVGAPQTLWALELARAAAADDFRHAVRAAVRTAVASRALSSADGAGLVRLAELLAPR